MFSSKFVALIISLLAFNNVLSFTSFTPSFVYVGFMAYAVFLAVFNSKHHLDILTSIFIGICFLSITNNVIPAYFKATDRFVMFVVVLFVISPLFKGPYINEVKRYCFKFSNYLIIGLTLLSFLGKTSGVYPGLDFASNFGGLTINSMTLSPLSGISLLICAYILRSTELSKKWSLFYKIALAVSFFTLILSASRIALVSAVIAVLFLLSRLYKRRIGKFIKVLLGFSLVLLLSYPLWKSYTTDLIEKTEERDEEGNQLSSREDLWAYRWEEFNQSPIIGIGFANSMYGAIDYTTGTVEPGTSWGAILAMTGAFGLCVFLILVLRTYIVNYNVFREDVPLVSHFLNALLIFFAIHWIAEGYMLAAGSYLFFYAWLLIGVSSIHGQSHKIEVL
jgi:O-antigen ligase